VLFILDSVRSCWPPGWYSYAECYCYKWCLWI